MVLFLAAALFMYLLLKPAQELNQFYLFMIYTFPVVLFFLYWMSKVWKDETQANFKNSFMMNLISTLCTTGFFINLIILNH